MNSASKMPVLDYSTGAGWQVLGYANNQKQATKIVANAVGDHTLSLLKKGWRIVVSLRSDLQRDLNGGPAGWVFSVTL